MANLLAFIAIGLAVYAIIEWRAPLEKRARELLLRSLASTARQLAWGHRDTPALSESSWGSATRALAKRYAVEPLSVGGRVFPVTLVWSAADRRIAPDAILGALDSAEPRGESPRAHRRFVSIALEGPKNRRENVNYVLRRVRTNDQLPKIDARLGLYYDQVISQAGLGRELSRTLSRRSGSHQAWAELARPGALPWRDRVDTVAPELSDGGGRVASLGVSTLFVFRRPLPNDDRYWTILAVRSQEVAIDKGKFHVVPAGMFEATYRQYETEWSVRLNVLREMLEELYGYKESSEPAHLGPDGIFGRPEVETLLALEQSNKAELVVTGISSCLLTRSLEICTLLLVDDPAFVAKFPPRCNWEYEPPSSGGCGFVPIDEVGHFIANRWRSPKDVAMPGLAATVLGVEWLRAVGAMSEPGSR